jgi:hypothetical protein
MRKVLKAIFWMFGGLMGVRLVFSYIDPNTGGIIFQALAIIFASMTGFLLFFSRQIRITTARIKRYLTGSSNQPSETTPGRSVAQRDENQNS